MKMASRVPVVSLVAAFLFCVSGTALAATSVNLGTAASFAVLAGTTVTNTGSSVVNGDLGLSPGTSVTGFPPGVVNGATHVTDTAAAQAQADLVAAYNAASSETGAVVVAGDLGGRTLTAGVYSSASSLGLTGTLTLDGQGNPSAIFVFQVGSALTTASGSSVNLINGAQACNVFWQVASSATLGTGSSFAGSILALQSVTATTGVVVNGRILARNGAVTLDINSVTVPTCAVLAVVTPTPVLTTPLLTVPPTAPPAVLTVPAASPQLPSTGLAPKPSSSIPWSLIFSVLAFAALCSLYALAKKKQVI